MKAKKKASSGAAKPLSASVRSTSSRPGSDLRRARADLGHRGAVADPVPELGEAELEVEDEIRVAKPERHLGELEVVEIGGAGDVVRLFAIPGRRSRDGLVDEPARLGHPGPHVGELVLGRGREGRRREGAGRDQRQQEREPAHQPCRTSTA